MKPGFAPLVALCLIGIGSSLLPGHASAQSIADESVKGPTVQGKPDARPAPLAPASAIPGASNAEKAAPVQHGATDLAPNDALFDAINRGDIASARDAINRGADFNARNVLGLTPLDQSIDLSRNDITFLLLSLRGATPGVGAYGPLTPSQAAKLNGKQGAPASAPQPTRTASSTPAPRQVAPAPAPRPVSNASLSASAPAVAQYPAPRPGNGGTPSPQNGFLGCGG